MNFIYLNLLNSVAEVFEKYLNRRIWGETSVKNLFKPLHQKCENLKNYYENHKFNEKRG